MGGNNSFNKALGGVPDHLRTHDEQPYRIDGHKILLQKANDKRVKVPMNSNSESPIYLCAHRKDDNTIEITTFGIYENHKCVAQVDLEFDSNGNYKPYVKEDPKTSHSHEFSENSNTGMIGRKSHDSKNCNPVNDKFTGLIQKIVEFNKAKHKCVNSKK